jgi:hypothetical protein
MHERAAASAFGRESIRGHLHDRIEVFPRELPIRPRAAHHREQLIF